MIDSQVIKLHTWQLDNVLLDLAHIAIDCDQTVIAKFYVDLTFV